MVKQCKNELNPMGVTKFSWSREKQFRIPSKDKFQFIRDVTSWVSLTIVILGAFGILPFHCSHDEEVVENLIMYELNLRMIL